MADCGNDAYVTFDALTARSNASCGGGVIIVVDVDVDNFGVNGGSGSIAVVVLKRTVIFFVSVLFRFFETCMALIEVAMAMCAMSDVVRFFF